jgi:hypothetical protein
MKTRVGDLVTVLRGGLIFVSARLGLETVMLRTAGRSSAMPGTLIADVSTTDPTDVAKAIRERPSGLASVLTWVELPGPSCICCSPRPGEFFRTARILWKVRYPGTRDLVKCLMGVKRVHAAMQQDLPESVASLDSAAPPAHS